MNPNAEQLLLAAIEFAEEGSGYREFADEIRRLRARVAQFDSLLKFIDERCGDTTEDAVTSLFRIEEMAQAQRPAEEVKP